MPLLDTQAVCTEKFRMSEAGKSTRISIAANRVGADLLPSILPSCLSAADNNS